MPSLMDLPTELHLQIIAYALYEPLNTKFGSWLGDMPLLSMVSTIRNLRSLSDYWASLVDQISDEAIERHRKRSIAAIRSNEYYNLGFLVDLHHDVIRRVQDARR